MRRTIPLLSGLAILGVVFNHANWHALRDFLPGAPGGYPFLVIDQVGKFAIAAFLFIGGYFIAYATNGGKNDLKWEIVRARLLGLLWPWLIWSAFFTLAQSFQGRAISLEELLRNLFIQYYFVPLLIFYYLLAPWIAHLGRAHLKLTLLGAAVVQVLGMALFYGRVYWPAFSQDLVSWVDVGPLQYIRLAFFFPCGLAVGMFPQKAKDALAKLKPWLLWVVLVMFTLSVGEAAWVYAQGNPVIWSIGGDQSKVTSVLLSLSIIACFVVFEKINLPLSKWIMLYGTRSYGLYLSHYVILGLLGKVFDKFLPAALNQGWLVMPLLFVLTAGLSMGLMELAARLPMKQFYRYVFG